MTEFPESRWAWLAAAYIQHEALLSLAKPGEVLGWPRPEVLRTMATPASAPLHASRARRGAAGAREWLLREQREDGSWPSPMDLRRASDVPPDQITIAVNALGARALLGQGKKYHAQVERALGFLVETDLNQRARETPVVYMDYTPWGAWSQLELLADAAVAEVGDRKALDDFAARLVEDLQARVRANGGWSYLVAYDLEGKTASEQSISFTTAAVVIGLIRAREMGAAVPADLITGGLDCLEAMRTEEGYYAYMLSHPGNVRQNSGPEGSAGRGPACELALFLGGRSSEDRLRLVLDHLTTHAGGLRAELGKSLMHAGPAAQGCHYLFFDYLMASRAADQLPPVVRKKYKALLTDLVLEAHLEDGSFQDTPILGRSYGTAAALLSLEVLKR